MPKDTPQTAALFRMVMPDHLCRYDLKSKCLPKRKDFEVEDYHASAPLLDRAAAVGDVWVKVFSKV